MVARAAYVPLLLLIALALVACGGQSLPTPVFPVTTPAATETDGEGASLEPGSSAEPTGDEAGPTGGEATEAPEESGPPLESAEPTETPPVGASATPSGAAACTGNTNNRTFFEMIAGQVAWGVYCAVLPGRWHVDTDPSQNTFSLAGGGRMQIVYVGPGGARFTLQEGNVCTAGLSACSPRDQTLGSAAFGDLQGGLVTLGPDMGFAIYVDPGQNPSWTATGTGMDQATFVALAAALHRVD